MDKSLKVCELHEFFKDLSKDLARGILDSTRLWKPKGWHSCKIDLVCIRRYAKGFCCFYSSKYDNTLVHWEWIGNIDRRLSVGI